MFIVLLIVGIIVGLLWLLCHTESKEMAKGAENKRGRGASPSKVEQEPSEEDTDRELGFSEGFDEDKAEEDYRRKSMNWREERENQKKKQEKIR